MGSFIDFLNLGSVVMNRKQMITLDEYNQITFKHFVHKLDSIRIAITCN